MIRGTASPPERNPMVLRRAWWLVTLNGKPVAVLDAVEVQLFAALPYQ